MSGKKTRRIACQAVGLFILVLFAGTMAHASEQRPEDKKPGMTEVKQKVGDAVQAIKQYSIDQKDQALAKAREALDKMDSKMDQLENRSREKWQQMSKASRAKTEEELRELRKKRNDIAEWYGGMKQSSARSWNKVKKGFVDSYHSLEQSFDKVAKKF